MSSSASSSYNSLQVSVQHTEKYANFLIGYTWSKSMDNGSGVFDPTNVFNPAASRAQTASATGGTAISLTSGRDLLLHAALSDTDASVGFWYTPQEIARVAEAAGLDCAIFGCVLYPYRFSALLRERAPRATPPR